MRHLLPLATLLCIAGLGRAACAQEAPVTTLRLSTRVVAISAVVKTRDGHAAAGLTRDDFVLRQDGQETPIRYFSQGAEQPLTLALMIDTSVSQHALIGDETIAADVFFDSVLGRTRANPADRATLVQFDDNVLNLAPLTSAPNRLHLALLRLDQRHMPRTAGGGTLMYDAIAETARGPLAHETGRKAMVLLTDGDDHGSSLTLEAALEQAQRADVAIYAIDYTLAQGRGGQGRAGIAGRAVLDRLAEATGGHVFEVTPALGLREIFAAIGDDLRQEYELGYTPPPETRPGSYHKLELRTNAKQLVVQARKGFYAQP